MANPPRIINKEVNMNNYEQPEMTVVVLSANDIIASSDGMNLPEIPINGW